MADGSGALWRVLGMLGDSPRKCGQGYEARCPAHDDRKPSLSIRNADSGKVLVRCHAGCDQAGQEENTDLQYRPQIKICA